MDSIMKELREELIRLREESKELIETYNINISANERRRFKLEKLIKEIEEFKPAENDESIIGSREYLDYWMRFRGVHRPTLIGWSEAADFAEDYAKYMKDCLYSTEKPQKSEAEKLEMVSKDKLKSIAVRFSQNWDRINKSGLLDKATDINSCFNMWYDHNIDWIKNVLKS